MDDPKKRKGHGKEAAALALAEKTAAAALAAEKAKTDQDNVFKLNDVNMEIPRGKLVAIVGPVGSGKSSLLQGIIGEMRRTEGTIKFCGSVAYCPQTAWIQVSFRHTLVFYRKWQSLIFLLENATVRENICFGRPFEEDRYWNAVHDACLEADLDMLPDSDLTEVGEKGISLSGGQKQRINICRAIYCNTDIQFFDVRT